jgi:hypothetical protein
LRLLAAPSGFKTGIFGLHPIVVEFSSIGVWFESTFALQAGAIYFVLPFFSPLGIIIKIAIFVLNYFSVIIIETLILKLLIGVNGAELLLPHNSFRFLRNLWMKIAT